MQSYENKYLKYKNKYLELKMSQTGGDIKIVDFNETDKKKFNFTVPEDIKKKYRIHQIKYEIKKDKHIYLIIIKLNDDDSKPVLFGMAGISNNSFIGTSNVILSKLNELEKKFSSVYLLQYASFAPDQNKAFEMRDKISGGDYKTNYNAVFKPERDMNFRIAQYINSIIKNKLNLKKVHLLGKCNGAWVAILLFKMSNRYKGLYLAVPGIASGANELKEIETSKLEGINFVFGFVKQDAYPYKWGLSCNEKDRYDLTMKEIKDDYESLMLLKRPFLSYKSKLYDYGPSVEADPKKYHEIHPDMIDLIIK